MKTKIKHPVPVSQTIQNKSKAANQAPVGKILQRYQDKTIQRQDIDEDELIQGKFETTQLENLDNEEEILQGKFFDTVQQKENSQLSTKNETGIPDNMKAGFEYHTGISYSNVRVNYNSNKPAQLGAHAIIQGDRIDLAPGQEDHLGHELGHYSDQVNGVPVTTQFAGVLINDDPLREKKADKIAAAVDSSIQLRKKNNNEGLDKKVRINGSVIQMRRNAAGQLIDASGAVVDITPNMYTAFTNLPLNYQQFIVSIERFLTNKFGEMDILSQFYRGGHIIVNGTLLYHYLSELAQIRRIPVIRRGGGHDQLSSHYDANDRNANNGLIQNNPQIGIDLPTSGHILFGYVPITGMRPLAVGALPLAAGALPAGTNTFIQTEMYGFQNTWEIMKHGLGWFWNLGVMGNLQSGLSGYSRNSEKTNPSSAIVQ